MQKIILIVSAGANASTILAVADGCTSNRIMASRVRAGRRCATNQLMQSTMRRRVAPAPPHSMNLSRCGKPLQGTATAKRNCAVRESEIKAFNDLLARKCSS
jgi:hypothetical protein